MLFDEARLDATRSANLGGMRPLPPFLVSILAPCLEHGATHVVLGRETIVLYRGEESLGEAQTPEGEFDNIVGLIRSLTEPAGDAGVFEKRKAVFQSPAGPLPVDVEIQPDRLRLTLTIDAGAARAESVVNDALTQSVRLGVQRIAFTAEGLAFWKDGKLEAVAELERALLPHVVAFARKLGSIREGERRGMAVLMGEARAMTLTIEIVPQDGEDTAVITRST